MAVTKLRHNQATFLVAIPEAFLAEVDKCVDAGMYGSRAEFIREATRDYVSKFAAKNPERFAVLVAEQKKAEDAKAAKEIELLRKKAEEANSVLERARRLLGR